MSDIQKIEHLTKRCSDLLAEMKRHERENIKNKRRADQLQKDKDQGRSELTKNTGLKEKLEKLCRELQKENNKLKVLIPSTTICAVRLRSPDLAVLTPLVLRMRTRLSRTTSVATRLRGTKSMKRFYRPSRITKKTKRIHGSKLLTWIWKSCSCTLPAFAVWIRIFLLAHTLQVQVTLQVLHRTV